MTYLNKNILLLVILTAFTAVNSDAQRRKGRNEKTPDRIVVGKMAPDFELPVLDPFLERAKAIEEGRTFAEDDDVEMKLVKLSSFRGDKPVVIVTSSYT